MDSFGIIVQGRDNMRAVPEAMRQLWPHVEISFDLRHLHCRVGTEPLVATPGWMVFARDPDEDQKLRNALAKAGISEPQGLAVHYRDVALARSPTQVIVENIIDPVVVNIDQGNIATCNDFRARLRTNPDWFASWAVPPLSRYTPSPEARSRFVRIRPAAQPKDQTTPPIYEATRRRPAARWMIASIKNRQGNGDGAHATASRNSRGTAP